MSSLEPFDLRTCEVALYKDGTSDVSADTRGRPRRVDGFAVGAPLLERNPPHGGEMHPDGDELVYVISGEVELILEHAGTEQVVELRAGQGLIVPRGVWHRVNVRKASQSLYVTPGPRAEFRSE